ncbi:MAG: acyl-homoserine-lactone synthase [Cyanobacteria bacterium P01_F01_bin.53]
MLQFHNLESLSANQSLLDNMLQDRRRQFIERLKWDIQQDKNGREYDEYDNEHARYVMWVGEQGEHLGSLRVSQTSKQCMIEDHFAADFCPKNLTETGNWEVTRFCTSPILARKSHSKVSSQLIKGLGLFGIDCNVMNYFGLCYSSMLRVYARLGWPPNAIQPSCKDKNLLMTTWNVIPSEFPKLYLPHHHEESLRAA